MAEGNGYKTVTRIIEYHGSEEWLEASLSHSRIPIQGVKQMQNGMYIKSGVIIWQGDGVTERQIEDANSQDEAIEKVSPELARAVEAAKTVIFKRPGE